MRTAALIGPVAYVVDDSGFPKDGPASVFAAHQYCGNVGKTTNCQVAVSVHQVTDHASGAASWRLFCPQSWDDQALDEEVDAARARKRRVASKVPDQIRHVPKWQLALDMLDEMTGPWGLPELPVAADAGYGDITAFRLGLAERGLHYVVAVKPSTSAYPLEVVPQTVPASPRGGRPSIPRYRDKHANLRTLAIASADQARPVTWRHGTRTSPGNPTAAMTGHFLALRVRPANRDIPRKADGHLPACWLLAEWPPHADTPTDYWLSNLPEHTPIEQLVHTAKIRWRIEHDYRELKTGLGLDHFEGRSYQGFLRHLTLVTLAQAFITQLRLDPKAPAPA